MISTLPLRSRANRLTVRFSFQAKQISPHRVVRLAISQTYEKDVGLNINILPRARGAGRVGTC